MIYIYIYMYIYTTIRLHTYLFTFVCLRAHSIVRNALQIHFVIWPTLRFAIYLHLHSYFIVSKNNDILRTLTPMVSFDPQKQTCISYSVVYDKTICLMPDTLFHINLCHFSNSGKLKYNITIWASCQIRKIAGAHAPGIPGKLSQSLQVSDPDMHPGTCVTHVPWCMPGSLISGFLWNWRRGKTFPAFPAHA